MHLDAHAFDTGQALLEQQAAGAKLMHPGRMAGFAGNKDDLFVGGAQRREREEEAEEETLHGDQGTKSCRRDPAAHNRKSIRRSAPEAFQNKNRLYEARGSNPEYSGLQLPPFPNPP